MTTDVVQVRVTEAFMGVSGTTLYEAVDEDGHLVSGPRVALVAHIHGNEPVGGEALKRFHQEARENLRCGSVVSVCANERAQALDLRHTPDGEDMNRLWDRERLEACRQKDPAERCYEESRVLDLLPVLTTSEVLLDLHSTSQPTPPCIIFRDDRRHAELVTRLGIKRMLTGLHVGAVLQGGLCSNINLAPGELGARMGFTFEAGQHQARRNVDRAWRVITRLLSEFDMWANVTPRDHVEGEVYEVIDRFRQAPVGAEPYRFVGFAGCEEDGGVSRARRLASFEFIEADEVLLRRGQRTVVRASAPFTMIMPTPTADPGTDLFYFTRRRYGAMPAANDTEARLQAQAIERMMDLIADDAGARGSTSIAFDDRQILDLCADLAGRVERLPEESPHRCLTVVGRGDWGGGESEERVGKRYRQSMRRALERGVRIDRIQLFRGAPLGWFDVLTSTAVEASMTEGHNVAGQRDIVRVFLSIHQPHTVSLLIAGDLELALRSGDARHVRVALVVEAATVEPHGSTAVVRVVRAGFFSSRLSFLKAAAELVQSLKAEHRTLIEDSAGLGASGIQGMVAADGALCPRSGRDLAQLRQALYQMQLGLWERAIVRELPEAVSIGDDAARGRWLAELMTRTGILDADALTQLLIRQGPDGWVADPSRLENITDYREFKARRRPRKMPHQVMCADEVGLDSLDRWVGWKRFLSDVQVVEGDRGKDLTLVFDDQGMQRTLASWYRRAREMAIRRPGRVMVVVAGDGLNPHREHLSRSYELLADHRTLLRDPRVRYLRILHAQGTHLSWMKDFLTTLEERPDEGEPVSVQWEVEHGGIVNVVLLCVRDTPEEDPWTLEGWTVERCAVVLSDLEGRGRNAYKMGVFTERSTEGRVNTELLHFGRSHCEGLLRHSEGRVHLRPGAGLRRQVEAVVLSQVVRWLRLARELQPDLAQLSDEQRGQWIGRHLGLSDSLLASVLGRHVSTKEPLLGAAEAVWGEIPTWPGKSWEAMR